VRIAGIDLPKNERVEISLTRIFGVGRTVSKKILQETGIDPNKKSKDLTDEEGSKIRTVIDRDIKVASGYWQLQRAQAQVKVA